MTPEQVTGMMAELDRRQVDLIKVYFRLSPEAFTAFVAEARRLVIDSLDPDVDDVATALGMMRCRLEPRLRRRGVRFDWQVDDLPALEGMGPEQYLHILRIVQEAVTNAIKHTRASSIRVATSMAPTGVDALIEIEDDGGGIAEGAGLPVRDLAALEWAMHTAFTAADSTCLDLATWQTATRGFTGDDWAGMHLRTCAGLTVLDVGSDCVALWRALADNGAAPEKVSAAASSSGEYT